jgi:glycosyltransferase involved in cell wall biosynthesis
MQGFPIGDREEIIVSVGQFRPEKDHELQLAAFALLHEKSTRWLCLPRHASARIQQIQTPSVV